MRIGLMYDGFSPFPAALGLIRKADELGLDSVWIAEHIPYRDALTPAMAVLGETRSLAVVPTAVSPYARHPVLIAMTLATLAERAPGRVRAVLGTGQPDDLEAIGLEPVRPLQTMKEALRVVRSALAGEAGLGRPGAARPRIQSSGARGGKERRLDFPPASPVPLYLAAVGPGMLRLAGKDADGALFSGGCSPAYVRWGAESVREGAREAGKRPEETTIASVVAASLSPDRKAAYRAVRRTLAFILRGPHHARSLELSGARLDREALADAVARGDWAHAEDLISEEVIRKHSVSGDEGEFRERLAEFSAVGLDVAVLLLQGSPGDRMRALEAAARM